MIKKLLIANRGEIALRIVRACKALGIETVGVYSTADANLMHLRFVDEAICIGKPNANQSYLDITPPYRSGQMYLLRGMCPQLSG